MRIIWTVDAWDEYAQWQTRDPKIAVKINDLVADIRRTPFSGIGKPEPLKADMTGFWARRINDEHRFVYRVSGKRGLDQSVEILQCRFHYDRRRG